MRVSLEQQKREQNINSLSARPCTFSFFFARHFCAAIRFLSSASNTGSFALPFPFSFTDVSFFGAAAFSEDSAVEAAVVSFSTGAAETPFGSTAPDVGAA